MRKVTSVSLPLRPLGTAMPMQPRALAASLSMAAAFLLILTVTTSLLKPSRSVLIQQQLAYDGPYDTPPVTWYYPANTG